MQEARVPATAPKSNDDTRTSGAAPAAKGAVQLKQSLRGMDLKGQLEALAPPDEGAAKKAGAGGAPVQMKIDSGTLSAKLSSTTEYSDTIDADTDCATANAVGEEWVGSGHQRRPYGEPFKYQLLSADGKKQYRPPMIKQSGAMVGKAQANYEARPDATTRSFPFNAHVTVTDIDTYAKKGA